MQSGDRQFVWTVQFWNATARYYIYISDWRLCSCYAASGGSVELQCVSKLTKYLHKITLNISSYTKPKIFLITLTLIPRRCSPNYIHSAISLTNVGRYIPTLTHPKVCNFYEGQTLYFLLSQLDSKHTSWFSYIHFNIIHKILLHRLSLDIY